MTPEDKQFFDDLNEPDDGILTAAKIRRAIRKMREQDASPEWVDMHVWEHDNRIWMSGAIGSFNMPTEELPISRNELPVCNMCRCGLHKKCIRVEDQGFCVCDCERGY